MGDICICGSSRWLEISGECDRELSTSININGTKQTGGRIPWNCNVGADECISFTVCLNCGKIQGEWPVRQDIILKNTDDDSNSNDKEACTAEDNEVPKLWGPSAWSFMHGLPFIRTPGDI